MYYQYLRVILLTLVIAFFSSEKMVAQNRLVNNTTDYTLNNDPEDTRRKIRLGFTAQNTMHRQLLLTEDENATPGIDWAYDSEYYGNEPNDIYWLIEDEKFLIQGTNDISLTTTFPLGFHTDEDGINYIMIDGLENISETFNLFIYDTEINRYHDLREGYYEFYADAGEYLNRFELTFEIPEVLNISDNELNEMNYYYANTKNTLRIENPNNLDLKQVLLYNSLGQLIFQSALNNASIQEINFNNKGVYIVTVRTSYQTTSKKILVH